MLHTRIASTVVYVYRLYGYTKLQTSLAYAYIRVVYEECASPSTQGPTCQKDVTGKEVMTEGRVLERIYAFSVRVHMTA